MTKCTRCKTEPPETEFSASDTRCKACNRERARLYRARYPGRQNAATLKYNQKYPERVLQTQKEWRERNVEQETARKLAWRAQNQMAYNFLQKASAAVKRAVKRGELVKPSSCEQCARADRRITVAHLDYLPPYLNIRWLCHSCHTTIDRWAA